jgi:hypothetical protein
MEHRSSPLVIEQTSMESSKVFVDNVDTFLSRIPAIIAQQSAPRLLAGQLHAPATIVQNRAGGRSAATGERGIDEMQRVLNLAVQWENEDSLDPARDPPRQIPFRSRVARSSAPTPRTSDQTKLVVP